MNLSTDEQLMLRMLPQRVRESAPLVYCLTNLVANNFTANVLLALGASPAMVPAPEDVADFAAIADAVLINIGTLDAQQLQAMRLAVAAANAAGKPWVFDPIAAGLPFRMAAARELMALRPAAIRGNAAEIMCITTLSAGNLKGVDSRASSDEASAAAMALAAREGIVIAVSGATDYVSDGRRILAVSGGHPLMTRVTGMGCALNAVIAAYIAVAKDPFVGTTAALAVFAECGKQAALHAQGNGSFAVAFLDALSNIDALPSPLTPA